MAALGGWPAAVQSPVVKLLRFSDDPAITMLEPRPVRVPPTRLPGREWLNGPLVRATDEPHAILYLFPRDCPRVVVWPTPHTTAEDRATWMGPTPARAVAYVEAAWMGCLRCGGSGRCRNGPALGTNC